MSQSTKETYLSKAMMMQGTLFVSFWELCLDNLSLGSFVHHCLEPQEAASLIEQAQAEDRLRCVCEHDLLAPYKQEERKRHKQLCEVLGAHFGISLKLNDFLIQNEHEGETLYSVFPLQLAQVKENAKLMVVTCAYTLPEISKVQSYQIDQDSVAFHLIETVT